jgi:hypothetical protein
MYWCCITLLEHTLVNIPFSDQGYVPYLHIEIGKTTMEIARDWKDNQQKANGRRKRQINRQNPDQNMWEVATRLHTTMDNKLCRRRRAASSCMERVKKKAMETYPSSKITYGPKCYGG